MNFANASHCLCVVDVGASSSFSIPGIGARKMLDGALLAPSWEPQEEGMMRTAASFPQL
jgi:hypothetical protein